MAQDDQLFSEFLTKLVEHAKKKNVITGENTSGKTVRKTVASGIQMIYVTRKTKARVEMWIYKGSTSEKIAEARDIFDHFYAKRTEIEADYRGELSWDHPNRRSAFSIQQDYDDFRLNQTNQWDEWIEQMVADMKRLDEALSPHYIKNN